MTEEFLTQLNLNVNILVEVVKFFTGVVLGAISGYSFISMLD